MTPKELEQTIRTLMQRPMADTELREQLEQLAAVEISFSGFTWLFGPELYRRNRILFRPFILSRFSTYMTLPTWKVEVIHWKGDKAKILDAWLAEVDKNDDADLFRRLYEWKLSGRFDWRKRDARAQEIIADLRHAFNPPAVPPGVKQFFVSSTFGLNWTKNPPARFIQPILLRPAPTSCGDYGLAGSAARPSARSGPASCSWPISATVCAAVWCAGRPGRDERSARASAPPCRNRCTHLATVRRLTPAASPAAAYVQPWCRTRSTSS
jgi:hypothetical protein